ncbi:MAG: hypothetical protein CO034_01495 [Parcubacteria group bacterium CG_4_9_14_0_2_um_filter_35_11]|nr:MAG: hypothetical protein CO034_01495 [Parcubacteria group bacterium CG_4_9_14_0_2_um_filter_35_11]
MFYQCPKCKKVWQYPIGKCPDCFLNLERIISEKIKVIGVSKVTIPTVLHPKAPYFVLALEDEHNNRWIEKSSQEYKIGDEFKREKMRNKAGVAILRVKYDIASAVEEIIQLINGIKFNSESKILILPTLISPQHPYFAQNTNPEILDALIKYLIRIGVKSSNIKVAAQSFDEIPIEASAQKSLLLKVCLENKITPLDLAKTTFLNKGKEGIIFKIAEEVFNNDIIINLPILKLDSKFKVKGALTNILKFLKKESYFSLKYLHDDFKIIERLQEVLPEYLTIGDGITVQKTTGHTSFVGLILASFNPSHLDRVFAEIAMAKDLPDYLKKININEIPIFGRKIEEVQYDIEGVGSSTR